MRTQRGIDLEARFEESERRGEWLVPCDVCERHALHRLYEEGKVVRPLVGCYARADAFACKNARERALCSIKTLAARHSDWTFCRYSAALLHGLQVSYRNLGAVHVIVPSTYARPSKGVVRHRMSVRPEDRMLVCGICATSVVCTVADCLCALPFGEGLALADSALHEQLTSVREIVDYLADRGCRRRGVRQAWRTLSYADERSGSGGESVARATMIELGFALPELQRCVFDPLEPQNPKYVDFYWRLSDGREIIAELDGLGKYTKGAPSGAQAVAHAVRRLSDERRREAHVNLSGAKVVRLSMGDVYTRTGLERILSAAGVPRQLDGQPDPLLGDLRALYRRERHLN